MNRAMRRAMKSKNPNRKAVGSNFSKKNNKILIDHKSATADINVWGNYIQTKLSKEEAA